MKVEILYFAGCPNHAAAVDLVRAVLSEESAAAEMVEVEIKDSCMAQNVGFLGSPSIRIDGQDVERSARSAGSFGLTCRTYVAEGRRAAAPPREWIRDAVREARATCALSNG
jgi:hypothetical protein